MSSNISTFFELHKGLYIELHHRMIHWDTASSKIGDIFEMMAPFFKMYTSYAANYDEASTKLPSEDELKDLKNQSGTQLDLGDLLIMPIQR